MNHSGSPKTWTVDVDGAEHKILVETDAETGKTQIRVDGRAAARPLGPQESARQFSIGSTYYVLRRDEGGELELDLDPDPPAETVAAPAYKLPPPVEKPPSRIKGKIIGVVIALLIIPATRWTIDVVRYMRVPWKIYDPADHQFRISFPTEPEETRDSITAGYNTLRSVKLQSRYHNHLYVLEWIELPQIIPREAEAELISGALDGIVKGEQAKLVQNGWSRVARRDAMHFIMQMPKNQDWSGGTARGHLVRSGRRIYIQYAYVPRRESLAFDVGEYLRSLDLPDE
jgi:hypothetical protein